VNIQKYIKINVSQENTQKELLAYEAWPQWMPGVVSVDIIKSEQGLSVLQVVSKESGVSIKATLEFDLSREGIIKFRQIKGWFKSYEGNWTFMPATEGAGLILKISVMLETGKFVPKSMAYSKAVRGLSLLGDALNKRLKDKKISVAEKFERQEPIAQKPLPHDGSKEICTETGTRRSICIFQTKKVWKYGSQEKGI
jgi:Polyketide cyclase / dehydrase and lipid transport.